MLSDLLKAAVEARGKVPQPDRQPGLSCSSLFPCPYRLYLVHMGKVWEEDLSAQEILNLEDGWSQEEQSVERLKKELGVTVKNRQARVTVGRSSVPGKIDGEVDLDSRYLWEHKAWATHRYDWFVMRGMESFVGEKSQINAYMLGRGLGKCIFYVKKKETNDYHDIVIELNKEFILPIIDWADRIRLDGWVPEPKLCGFCSQCGVNCFDQVLDFSWIKDAQAPEIAEKWRTGDKYIKIGEMLIDEARLYFLGEIKDKGRRVKKFEGLIGDKDILLVEGLKCQKIVPHRFNVSKADVLRVFGPEGLMKVGKEDDTPYYKITNMEE